jgi:hypothetical protein
MMSVTWCVHPKKVGGPAIWFVAKRLKPLQQAPDPPRGIIDILIPANVKGTLFMRISFH